MGPRVYHRGAEWGRSREGEWRGRALPGSAFLPPRRAGEAARRRAAVRGGARPDARPLPPAPQPGGPAREGRGRDLQPPPAQAGRLRRLDARPRAGGDPLVGLVRRLRRARRLRPPVARIAGGPGPQVLPGVAARALPRVRIALHPRRRRPRPDRHPGRAARGLGAAAHAGRRALRRRAGQPAAQVGGAGPPDAAAAEADSSSGLVGAARTRHRLLRRALRPARDGVDAGGGRDGPRPRAVAARRGGTHPRPVGQGGGRSGGEAVPHAGGGAGASAAGRAAVRW